MSFQISDLDKKYICNYVQYHFDSKRKNLIISIYFFMGLCSCCSDGGVERL